MGQRLEAEVRRFIVDNYILDPTVPELVGSDSLTGKGVLDSMGVLELILFLEERYGVRVPDNEMTPRNLDTIDGIVNYLQARLSERGDARAAARAGSD